MADERGPRDEELFTQRLEEQEAKGRLSGKRVKDAVRAFSNPEFVKNNPDSVFDGVAEAINAIQMGTLDFADSVWIKSLQDAGLPSSTILRVWDVKDEISRKIKEQAQSLNSD